MTPNPINALKITMFDTYHTQNIKTHQHFKNKTFFKLKLVNFKMVSVLC